MNLSNKIAGCIYGYAIGDALGLGSELMSKREIKRRYPDGLRNYQMIIRDAHRMPWERGQFTHDTTLVLELIESLAECNGPDHHNYARRLKNWYHSVATDDIDAHIRLTLSDDNFLNDPHGVCRKVFLARRPDIGMPESLGRAMLLGLWNDNVEVNVRNNALLTNHHNSSIGASVIVASMANELLWHKREADFDRLCGIAQRIDPSLIDFLVIARDGELSDLDLDDEETMTDVRKIMAGALWGMWHHDSPLPALYAIVDEGGDADTTGALAMGFMGLKYGFDHLPPVAINELIGKERVEKCVNSLVDLLSKQIPTAEEEQ